MRQYPVALYVNQASDFVKYGKPLDVEPIAPDRVYSPAPVGAKKRVHMGELIWAFVKLTTYGTFAALMLLLFMHLLFMAS